MRARLFVYVLLQIVLVSFSTSDVLLAFHLLGNRVPRFFGNVTRTLRFLSLLHSAIDGFAHTLCAWLRGLLIPRESLACERSADTSLNRLLLTRCFRSG